MNYAYNEVDNNGAALGQTPLAISPIPGGGSRLAFLGKTDSMAHVVTLDTLDEPVPGTAFALPAFDFQDIYADATGGVMLLSRNALGSTDNHNCGNINNLCGLVANYPTAASCYDLYIVRFNGSTESWSTKLTQTSATLPAYGVSATSGGNVIFIWSEYAHNGRIAFDGTNYASYFGAAITVPNQGCVGSSTMTTGVNIHQGDRMQAVNGTTGALLTTPGFSFGCSHSGYERILWDPTNKVFVNVCKNDLPTGGKSGKIGFAPNATTIVPIDLNYDQIGSVINATGGGYWIFESDIRAGQTPNANGMFDIHLLHVPKVSTPTPDKDIVAVSDGQNDRAPHLAPYGTAGTQMLAAWESSTALGDFAQNPPAACCRLAAVRCCRPGLQARFAVHVRSVRPSVRRCPASIASADVRRAFAVRPLSAAAVLVRCPTAQRPGKVVRRPARLPRGRRPRPLSEGPFRPSSKAASPPLSGRCPLLSAVRAAVRLSAATTLSRCPVRPPAVRCPFVRCPLLSGKGCCPPLPLAAVRRPLSAAGQLSSSAVRRPGQLPIRRFFAAGCRPLAKGCCCWAAKAKASSAVQGPPLLLPAAVRLSRLSAAVRPLLSAVRGPGEGQRVVRCWLLSGRQVRCPLSGCWFVRPTLSEQGCCPGLAAVRCPCPPHKQVRCPLLLLGCPGCPGCRPPSVQQGHKPATLSAGQVRPSAAALPLLPG